jgi:hypothetical protein
MNRLLTSAALAVVFCAPVCGFAQENPLSAPRGNSKSNTGVVVFFRERKYLGGGIAYKVREGDVEIGKLSNGSYFTVRTRAGKHEYNVHAEARDVITIEVEPGETHFVSFGVGVGVVTGRPNLSPSDRKTFIKLQGDLKDVTGKGINRGAQ